MDKYSVVQNETKTSGPKGKCPVCGRALDAEAPVKRCPKHGTKPFEPKDRDGDNPRRG